MSNVILIEILKWTSLCINWFSQLNDTSLYKIKVITFYFFIFTVHFKINIIFFLLCSKEISTVYSWKIFSKWNLRSLSMLLDNIHNFFIYTGRYTPNSGTYCRKCFDLCRSGVWLHIFQNENRPVTLCGQVRKMSHNLHLLQ